MTTAYTSLLGLALPVQGELQGTWGDTVNNSITSLLDTAVAGTTTLSTDADVTLTTTTGASNQARQAIILWTASGTVTRNITAPAQSKIYTVINKTGSTQSIVIRGVGPTTGVTIPAGSTATVAWNGSDFVDVNSTRGGMTLTGNLLFSPDNTYDIGANGATRPRSIYLAKNIFINASTASNWDSNWQALQGSSGSFANLSTGGDLRIYQNAAIVGGSAVYVANGVGAMLQLGGNGLVVEQYASGTANASISSITGRMKFTPNGRLGVGYASTDTPVSSLSVKNGDISIQNTSTALNTEMGALRFYDDFAGSNYQLGNIAVRTGSAADRGYMRLSTGYASGMSLGIQLDYGSVSLYGCGGGVPSNVYFNGTGSNSGARDIAYLWYSSDVAAKKFATIRVGTTGTGLDDNSTTKLHTNVNGTTYDTLVLNNNQIYGTVFGANGVTTPAYPFDGVNGTASASNDTGWVYQGAMSGGAAYFGNGAGIRLSAYTNNGGNRSMGGLSAHLQGGGSGGAATDENGGLAIWVKTGSSASISKQYYFMPSQMGVNVYPLGWANVTSLDMGSYASLVDFSPGTWLSNNLFNDGVWKARTGTNYSTLYQMAASDGSHQWYSTTSTTAANSQATTLTLNMALTRGGNLGVGLSNPLNIIHAYKSSGSMVLTLQSGSYYAYYGNDGSTYATIGSNYGTTGIKLKVALQAPDDAVVVSSAGNMTVKGNIYPAIYYSTSISISGNSSGTWYTLVSPGGLAQGYYLCYYRWDHGGSGNPYIVAGGFQLNVVNTNGSGGDNTFVPLNSTHTGSGATISWRSLAGSSSTTGLQYNLSFSGNGNLYVDIYKIA